MDTIQYNDDNNNNMVRVEENILLYIIKYWYVCMMFVSHIYETHTCNIM